MLQYLEFISKSLHVCVCIYDIYHMYVYGSGLGTAAVLLPGFAISW